MPELPYRIVVGLEVHVQLLTRTKLFCGCSTRFGLPANTATCPVCLGLPGSLPVMNRRAFDLALRAALALNCRVAPFTKWDRKNYFYPDLPKNYQISQYDLPLGSEGYLEIETEAGPKRVGIIRAHLEEDAGKLLHDETGRGGESRVDLNRAGTPLLEIVSKPELASPEEARTYLEKMRELMQNLGVSDGKMQEGSLRCDANVNVHVDTPEGTVATPIVEVKNLNSFAFLEAAIRYEAKQQYEKLRGDPDYRMGKADKTTAGWDEVAGKTFTQRRKELAEDYRYFPEPDLVPVVVDAAWLDRVRAETGELPDALRRRLAEQYGLSDYDVGVLAALGRPTVAYFEEAARVGGDAKAACNWVTNQIQATLKETGGTIEAFPIPAAKLGELVGRQKELGKQAAGQVYARLVAAPGEGVAEAVAALGLTATADASAVLDLVRQAMAANPKAVADYRKGKKAAANSLKGAVMKGLRQAGAAVRVEAVEEALLRELDRPEENP